jgi:predicted RNA methylase
VPDLRAPAFPADIIPIQYHFNMLNDSARMDGFEAAIAAVVRPGMRVLELGGGTGVLSWFAARQGAARVWCVEKLPEMVVAARTALAANEHGDRVTVVNADADDFLPPEPVDVVICEMLHTGLLREKQLSVIGSFKRRYLDRFGGPLPRMIPEATLQAIQPVQQDFAYNGYLAATPIFQDARSLQPRTVELGPPHVFQAFTYDQALPDRCAMDSSITITRAGTFNAVRVVTKNLLAIQPSGGSPEWIMGYLVLPLATPLAGPFAVAAGDEPHVSFDYRPGDELNALASSLVVTTSTVAAPVPAGYPGSSRA